MPNKYLSRFHRNALVFCVWWVLLSLLPLGFSLRAQSYTLSGRVLDERSSELLPGVNIYSTDGRLGTTTNAYGFYAVSIPPSDTFQLVFSYLGYASDTLFWSRVPARDIRQDIHLRPSAQQLKEIDISAVSPLLTIRRKAFSGLQLSGATLQETPMLLGEKDVFKTFQLLPGVQNPREGFSGLFVRGGDYGQNLILVDEASVYNAHHLFGLFSAVNPDVVKQATLLKGSFPARYGGRIASVMDIQLQEGNLQEFQVDGGVGLLSSRLSVQGPILKNRLSFLVSGRRTYLDGILDLFDPEAPDLFFQDFNAKLHARLGERDRIYLSGYHGRDNYHFQSSAADQQNQNGFDWGNTTGTVRWNRIWGKRWFSNTTVLYSDFNFRVFNIDDKGENVFSSEFESGIQNYSVKQDVEFIPNSNHHLRFGGIFYDHDFTLSAITLRNVDINEVETRAEQTKAREWAVYGENTQQIGSNWRMNYGLRYSQFAVEGERYRGWEPRLSLTWEGVPDWSFSGSYARAYQYLHLLSNSGEGMPTDLWVPATGNIAPQIAQQWSLGAVRQLPDFPLRISGEIYFRDLDNVIGYREGASFLLLGLGPDPQEIEQIDVKENITIGDGYATGLELLADYEDERWRAWLSYTLAWVQHRLDGVNGDNYFWAAQDRRHNLALNVHYQCTEKWSLGTNFVFGSGVPVSLPVSTFGVRQDLPRNVGIQSSFTEYTDRNAYRMPIFHRLDVSLSRQGRWARWELGLYNFYNRVNPFYLEIGRNSDNISETSINQVGLFPMLPYLNFNFAIR